MATRKSSSIVIEGLTKFCPNLIGGSADLSGSNNTITKNYQKHLSQEIFKEIIYTTASESMACHLS